MQHSEQFLYESSIKERQSCEHSTVARSLSAENFTLKNANFQDVVRLATETRKPPLCIGSYKGRLTSRLLLIHQGHDLEHLESHHPPYLS